MQSTLEKGFLSVDKAHKGYVTKQDVRDKVTLLDFDISEQEVDLMFEVLGSSRVTLEQISALLERVELENPPKKKSKRMRQSS
jgi:Ca2+-binding EF-hand superfamily protein